MESRHTQLEQSLLKKNGFGEFITSDNADVAQVCSAKFEPTLRRIAFQAMSNNDTACISMVLRVTRLLCEQNERKGIHMLISAGLPDIIGRIFGYISDFLVVRSKPTNVLLDALRIFLETLALMVPLMKDKCVWFKSTLYSILTFLSKCYICQDINLLVVDSVNQVLSVLSKEDVYVIRDMVVNTPELVAVCKQFISDIAQVGDFLAQCAVVEMVARITSNAFRHSHSLNWNNDDKLLAELFCNLSYTEMDVTSLLYLNAVNERSRQCLVRTTSYSQVKMGNRTYTKGDHAWIHFCESSRRISLCFPLEGEFNQTYESIERDMIKSFAVSDKNGDIVIVITTKEPLSEHFDEDIVSKSVNELTVVFHPTPALTHATVQKLLTKYFTDETVSFDALPHESASKPAIGYVAVDSTSNNSKLAYSQNVVATSQPTPQVKESKCAVNTHTTVSESRPIQGSKRLALQQNSSGSDTVKQKPQQDSNDSHLSMNSSTSTQHNTSQRISMPVSFVRFRKDSQEIVPETQGMGFQDASNTSSDLHLSQLHSNSKNQQLASKLGPVAESEQIVCHISKPEQNVTRKPSLPVSKTNDRSAKGIKHVKNDSKTESKGTQELSSLDAASTKALASSESASCVEAKPVKQRKQRKEHSVKKGKQTAKQKQKDSSAVQTSSAESCDQKVAKPIKRYAADASDSKPKQTTSRQLRNSSHSVTKNKTTKNSTSSKSSIAEKVNAQFQNLQSTLNTSAKSLTPSKIGTNCNPVVILSTQEVSESKLKTFNGTTTKNMKHKPSSEKENQVFVEKDKRSKPRTEILGRKKRISAKGRKKYTAEDVAKHLFNPDFDRLSEEMPETVRCESPKAKIAKDFLATTSDSLPDVENPSDDVPLLAEEKMPENKTLVIDGSPGLKQVTTIENPDLATKTPEHTKISAAVMGSAFQQQVKQSSKHQTNSKKTKATHVSFDPYEMSTGRTKSTFLARKTPKRRTKKDKLFDTSGFSSTASTCSDVSWVQEYKKKAKGGIPSKPKAKPRTYEPKHKKKSSPSLHLSPPPVAKQPKRKETTVEVFVTSDEESSASPERARDEMPSPNHSFFQNDPLLFSFPADLNKSFHDIIEEEEERMRREPDLIISSKHSTPQKISPFKLTPKKTPVVIHKVVLTPISRKSKTSSSKSTPTQQELQPTQYTHISSVKTPKIAKTLEQDQQLSELDNSFGLNLKCDDEPVNIKDIASIVEPFVDPISEPELPSLDSSSFKRKQTRSVTKPEKTYAEEPSGPLRKLPSAKTSNSRTPQEFQLSSSGRNEKQNQERKHKKRKRRVRLSRSSLSDETSEEDESYTASSSSCKRSRKRPKKLEFSLLQSLSGPSSSTSSHSIHKPICSYQDDDDVSDFDDDDEVNVAISKLVKEIGVVYKQKRAMRERPIRNICKAMSKNLTDVKHLWKKFNIKREGDLESFKYKFSKLARRHSASVKKIGALEGAAQRCLTSLNHQFKNLLKNSVDTLSDIKEVQCQLADNQRRSDKEFQLAVRQVNEKVRRDLEKISRSFRW